MIDLTDVPSMRLPPNDLILSDLTWVHHRTCDARGTGGSTTRHILSIVLHMIDLTDVPSMRLPPNDLILSDLTWVHHRTCDARGTGGSTLMILMI